MKIFTQITKILFTLLISVFISSAALAQCVTPVFTSIGNSGPVCTGGTITLNAAGTVGGISSGFIRMAGIGANYGHQAFNDVFSSGDRAGSMARISMAQFDAIFAGLPTDAARAAALKAQYDVLMFTWASPIDYNITLGLITAYLSTGGSVFIDGDYANVLRLNDGTSNSIVGVGSGTTGGCAYTLVSPAPFPTLVANGVNGCFANDHLFVTSWPTWMKPYITAGGRTLAIAGIYPGGSGGRLIVQGPDQDYHARRGGSSTERNQYQIILNQIDFLKANQSGITWTGPNGFTSNDANATITNVTAANAGVYTATLTNITGGGCSVTATTTVVVSTSTPTITASGPTNFCPGGSVTLTASAGTSYNWSNGATTQSILVSAAGNYTVTVTNTGCSGTSAPTAVIVQDLVSPVFTSTQANTIVALDATTGTALLADYTSAATATDNCSVSGITQFPLAGTALANNVPATVTLTATDPSGNKATQSFTVTATDQTPPVVSTKNITVFLDASGNATITPASVDNGSIDNVGITTYSLDKSAFNCTNVGTNTVNLTVSDAAGNTSSASAVVTVQDVIPPTVLTQNITVQLDAEGNATITAAQINNGSTDNCAIATYALDKTTFGCSNAGANTVTLTVTDIHGNASTATAMVTVQDNVLPVVKTKNITVYLSGGNATITPAQVDNGSNDACGIKSMTLNKTTFDCSTQGAQTVTLTVTDNNGNVSTGTAVVTVIGKTPTPSIAVSRTDNTYTKLDANTIALGYGAQKLTLTASNPNSAPGASTFIWSPSAGLSNANIANPVFTPVQAGTYTFNVLVTSEYGCQASTSVTITVIDVRCGNKGDKVLVCHNTGSGSNPYVQICISANAVATQLAKGGILGTCQTMTVNEKMMAVAGSDLLKVSKDPNGTKDVVSPQDQLNASNILSPNGDGQNDTWVISNLDKYPYNKVTILDRNGKVVYTKENYKNDWDGTFRTGILPEDTYYYILELGKGLSPLKGFISIVR